MEVKPGYKQTEVGVIPEDWEVLQLKSLGVVIRGSSPRPKGDKRFYGGDIPRLMVEDVTRDKKFVSPQIDFLTKEGAKRSRPCKAGTLTVVCSGTPGVVGLPSFLAVDACIHDGMMALVGISPTVVPDYLFHQLTSYQERLYSAATHGGTFVNLTTTGFRGFFVTIPSTITEQRAIAEALSDADELLGALDRLIAKKRDLKQATMQQLLTGQTRLPGFRARWDVVTLGSLFEFKNGLNKGKEFFGYGTPIVNYMDVFAKSTIQAKQLNGRVSLTPQEIQNFDVRRGDVFFTRTSETTDDIGVASVMLDEPIETVFSGFVLRGRPINNRLCDTFKAYCFKTRSIRTQIVSKASYTTRALTNGRILASVQLQVPPLTEQTAIAEVLSDMDSEIEALEQRREKTRLLKQGMMQELLTGRTRLV